MIPTSIYMDKDNSIQVILEDRLKSLGSYDEKENVIRLRSNLSDEQKMLILLHEIIHVAESQLIAYNVLGKLYNRFFRKIWGEKLVTHLAPLLFAYLGQSGMIAGLDPQKAISFVESNTEY